MDLKKRNRKIILYLLAFILLGAISFFALRYLIYYKIRQAIQTELSNLKKQAIDVSYDKLEIYPAEGRMVFRGLLVKVRKDSINHGLDAVLPYVVIKGIDVVPFITNRTLTIHTIYSQESYIHYAIGSTLFKQVSSQRRKVEFRDIRISRIDLPGIDLYLEDSVSQDTIAHILSDVDMRDLYLVKQVDSLTWREGEIDISNFAMRYSRELYGVSLKNIHLAISEKSITVDSVFFKPVVGRNEFMVAKGKQTEYMEGSIPYLQLKGIDWYTFPTATLQIRDVSLRLNMKTFRDKRYPFRRYEPRPLPAHFVHRIPIRLKIDTIRLQDSFVSYEEFPEEGDSSGLIYFDKLNATISNLHNDPRLKKNSVMVASASFMGAGDLNARFVFPYDTLNEYSVRGTLKNMPMVRVNNILGSVAQVKFESGHMTDMTFSFSYNNLKSSGDIEMAYENLKIVSLRENKNNEQKVSLFKTLLFNTFIIQKDIGEEVTDDTRRGKIEFYRDQRRSVFNFWWKSILSGIKSANYMDKLPMKAVETTQKKKVKKKNLKETISRIFKKKQDKNRDKKE